MSNQNNGKIQSTHLSRKAYVYLRQSTMVQVEKNTASTMRQYELKNVALEMGWKADQIHIVDEDLGVSGSSTEGREGYKKLVQEVAMEEVGAIFCLEQSRLARDAADTHSLIKLCAITDTLIIDLTGVYDLNNYSDRLLLGIKGAISEAELHLIRERLQGGALRKAQEGKYRVRLPVGYIYDANNEVVKDPDEQVQKAIQLAFDKFDELPSAPAVVRYFHKKKLLFPTRPITGKDKNQIVWKPLNVNMIRKLLQNPAYSGTYVYGRTTQVPREKSPKTTG